MSYENTQNYQLEFCRWDIGRFQVRHFPVLHFPALQFGPSFSRSFIFHCCDSGPAFSGAFSSLWSSLVRHFLVLEIQRHHAWHKMRPIVTVVAWSIYLSVCVCMSVGHIGVWTLVDPRNRVLNGGPDPLRGNGRFSGGYLGKSGRVCPWSIYRKRQRGLWLYISIAATCFSVSILFILYM